MKNLEIGKVLGNLIFLMKVKVKQLDSVAGIQGYFSTFGILISSFLV